MNIDEYTVGLARREHIRMLPEIELAAAALFPDDLLTPEIRASTVAIEQLEAAYAEGRLWTAATQTGSPVGFAIAIRESNSAFVQEVDVHPAHQRKGLGRRLIQNVIGWAQAQKFSCVALTTFEYVPWNAPFYSRLGFRKLAEHELSRELLERLQAERRQGLNQRVAMQITLGPEQQVSDMGPFKDGWTIEDVEAVIARDIPEEMLYVPIVVSMDPPDCEWAHEICISLVTHGHFNVRGNAILGFGHLARTCRRLDLVRVLPLVSAALKDEHEYVRGHAIDVVEDIKHYLKVSVPGSET